MTGPSPYLGLAAYTESDDDAARFFGRESESRLVAANLISSRLTVLYGPAGVGKSSLLRAGLLHRFRRDRPGALRVAVAYVDRWGDDPAGAILQAVAAEAGRLGYDNGSAPLPGPETPLDEALHAWEARLDARLLVILDQFEEYCLYHPPDELAFDEELPRAIERRDLRARFLIGIREDALAALDRYKGRVGDLFGNRLRLDHLSREAAADAIRRPVDWYNATAPNAAIELEPGLAEAVVEQLAPGRVALATQGRGTAGGRSSGADTEDRVETPYLQLVMAALWRREMEAGSTTLRVATVRRMGGATQVVRDHVDRVMHTLSTNQQETAAGALHFLITPSGAKVAHTAGDLAAYAGVPRERLQPVLERLCSPGARLLRPIAAPGPGGDARYEIFHDVLGPAILDWRARAHARRLRRRISAVLAMSFALIVGLLGSILYTVDPGWSHRLERDSVDARASVGGPAVAANDITIVDIDKSTLTALGESWPPNRAVHGRIIDAVLRLQPRVIAYDVVFARGGGLADRALLAAVRRAGDRIVLGGKSFEVRRGGLLLFGRGTPGGTDALLDRLGGAHAAYIGFPLGGGDVFESVEADVTLRPDTRRVPTLAFQVARLAGLRVEPWVGPVPIEFRGGPGTIRTVRAGDLLAGRVPADALRGKLVVVGTTHPLANEFHKTPISARMPGAEIQANAILTTVGQTREPVRDILLIVVAALIPCLLVGVRPALAALAVAAAAAVYVVAAQLWFESGRIVPIALPLGALALSALGLAVIRGVAARRGRAAVTRQGAVEPPQGPAAAHPSEAAAAEESGATPALRDSLTR